MFSHVRQGSGGANTGICIATSRHVSHQTSHQSPQRHCTATRSFGTVFLHIGSVSRSRLVAVLTISVSRCKASKSLAFCNRENGRRRHSCSQVHSVRPGNFLTGVPRKSRQTTTMSTKTYRGNFGSGDRTRHQGAGGGGGLTCRGRGGGRFLRGCARGGRISDLLRTRRRRRRRRPGQGWCVWHEK